MTKTNLLIAYYGDKAIPYTDLITQVYDFNRLITGTSATDLNPLDNPNVDFLKKAFNEEIDEFVEGYDQQDVVKMVDSLLDLIYFAVGGLTKMGVTEDQAQQCFAAVHTANMTKRLGKLAKRGDFDRDAVKPEDFKSPDELIRQILLNGKV